MKNLVKTLFILLLSLNLFANSNLEKVTLQLDWKYQFEFVGFIAALEKGFYKEAGFDVTIKEQQKGVNAIDEVLSQRATFGTFTASLIAKDGKLQPTVVLATYFHKSPLVFIAQPEISLPSMLKGKRIMATQDEFESSPLSFLLEHFNINKNNSQFVHHSYHIEDFKNKKVDAMSVYMSNEIYELQQKNVKYNIIDPEVYGFVTNAMNLFSSYEYVKNNPEKVKKFIDASNKGWEYAINHTSEMIGIIHKKYESKKSLEALKYKAKIIKGLMLLDLYDIGEVDENLIKRLYKQLIRSGKLKIEDKLDKYTFNQVLLHLNRKELFFTKEELDFLKKKGIIKLCVDPARMPFEGLDKNNKYEGIVSEYFKFVQEKLPIPMIIHPTKTWKETINAMKDKECDIIASATPTKSRLKYMNFTQPYMLSPMVLITNMDKTFIEDIGDVRTEKIGVTKGYAIAEKLRRKYPGINLVEVKDTNDGLQRLEKGELFGYINNLHVSVANIQENFNGILKVSSRLDESDVLSIGSRNDEPLLNEIFQKIIESIDKSKIKKIANSWISVKESVDIDYTFLWKIFALIVLLLIIIIVHQYKLRSKNKVLNKISRTDTLTQVANRLKLNEELQLVYYDVKKSKISSGIILLDVDDFKIVNDVYGHLFGDEVLKKISQVLVQNVRRSDIVGRWGGEEFLIVCRYIKLDDLKKIAEVLRQKIEDDEFLKEKNITASFGLSIFDGIKDIDEVINEADENLYKAKSHGKNRVYFTS
ncbi:diguanylate cyclase domain-containing protein [Sulfurospirillum sp. 1307]